MKNIFPKTFSVFIHAIVRTLALTPSLWGFPFLMLSLSPSSSLSALTKTKVSPKQELKHILKSYKNLRKQILQIEKDKQNLLIQIAKLQKKIRTNTFQQDRKRIKKIQIQMQIQELNQKISKTEERKDKEKNAIRTKLKKIDENSNKNGMIYFSSTKSFKPP